MYTVKERHYGESADGRTVLLFRKGAVITDDEARTAGLLPGDPSARKPQHGLVIEPGKPASDERPPAKPLARMNLSELRALCDAEGIDAGQATLRAEFIEAIEVARAAVEPAGDPPSDAGDGEGG